MFRKLFLSAAVAVMSLTGVASAAPVDSHAAHDRDHDRDRDRDRHRVRYEVLVRHRGHWDVYDTYRDFDDARRAAWRLQRQGEDVRIEVERRRW